MRPEQACRNSAEVVRRHYVRLEQEGTKVDAMARLEQAYQRCAASVQLGCQKKPHEIWFQADGGKLFQLLHGN
jgi:hypothetical protein